MPLFAFALGFLAPWMFCLDLPQRTAVAFEVSLQNVSLAITIVTVAFPNAEVASYYSQYIILYGAFQIVFGVTISMLFQMYFRFKSKTTPCHQYARWKSNSAEAQNPDLQTVTANGTTLKQDVDSAGMTKPESFSNMAYTGSSLSLTHMDSDRTGTGFVPDGQVGSSTQLVRLDSVDSEIDFSPNGSMPASPSSPDDFAMAPNGYIQFTTSHSTTSRENCSRRTQPDTEVEAL